MFCRGVYCWILVKESVGWGVYSRIPGSYTIQSCSCYTLSSLFLLVSCCILIFDIVRINCSNNYLNWVFFQENVMTNVVRNAVMCFIKVSNYSVLISLCRKLRIVILDTCSINSKSRSVAALNKTFSHSSGCFTFIFFYFISFFPRIL